VRWNRARAVEHVDAYARVVLIREFLTERRSGWARRVTAVSSASGMGPAFRQWHGPGPGPVERWL
jgi:hypothetical protein